MPKRGWNTHLGKAANNDTFQNPRQSKREREFRTLKERFNRPTFRTLENIQPPRKYAMRSFYDVGGGVSSVTQVSPDTFFFYIFANLRIAAVGNFGLIF